MPLPYPHLFIPDVTRLTPELLQRRHIQGLLLDIDGTLMPTHQDQPLPAVLAWLTQVRQAGVALCLLSNSRRGWRVEAFGKQLGLPWRNLAKKPFTGGFRWAEETLGLPCSHLAMVGDQIFTDVWGARRAGCQAVLVESTDTDLWYFSLRRLAELPFRKERP